MAYGVGVRHQRATDACGSSCPSVYAARTGGSTSRAGPSTGDGSATQPGDGCPGHAAATGRSAKSGGSSTGRAHAPAHAERSSGSASGSHGCCPEADAADTTANPA